MSRNSNSAIPLRLLPLMLLFFLPLSSEAAPTGEEVIRKLENTFAGIETLRADFKQEADISVAGIEKQEESTGIFYLKKPGNIKWVYLKPDKEILLLKNDLLLFYSEPDKQLLKRKVTSLKDSANYLALLLNPNDSVLRHYTLKGMTEENGIHEVKLVPKGTDETLKTLSLFIRKDNFMLEGLSFTDNLENVTRITFGTMTINPVIADDLFTLQVPEGTDIVDFNNDN